MKTKIIISLFSATMMISCSTTGDPRSGGIFWSPSKADARIDQLNRTNNEAMYQKQKAENRNTRLKSEKTRELNTY